MVIYTKKHVISLRLSKRLDFVAIRSTTRTGGQVKLVDNNARRSVSLNPDWLWNQRFVILHKLPGYVCRDDHIRGLEHKLADELGIYMEIYEFLLLQPRLSELLSVVRNGKLYALPPPVVSSPPPPPPPSPPPTGDSTVRFEVSGRVYGVARARIETYSCVLSTMISARWSSTGQDVYRLDEDDSVAPFAGDFFGFFNAGGHVEMERSKLVPLMTLADKYCVDRLTKECSAFLQKYVSSGVSAADALGLWNCCKRLSPECSRVLLAHLCMNMTETVSCTEFLSLDYDSLKALLLGECAVVLESEQLLLESLRKWNRKRRDEWPIHELVDARALQPDKLLLYEDVFDKEQFVDALRYHACPFEVRYARQLFRNAPFRARTYLCDKATEAGEFRISSSSADRNDCLRVVEVRNTEGKRLRLTFEKLSGAYGGLDVTLVFYADTGGARQILDVLHERLDGSECSHALYVRIVEALEVEIIAECRFLPHLPAKRKLVF